MSAPRRWPLGRWILTWGLVYLAASLLLWWHVWFGGHPASVVTCNCGDPTEQVWWLGWLPWALEHGTNPFISHLIWARLGGVNAMTNTSWFFPAAVLSPATLLWGPVLSFNLANLLGPLLSALAAGYLGRELGLSRWGAGLAGAVYGYSPFVLDNNVLGHLDLTLIAYLPLVAVLGLRVLRGVVRPVKAGVIAGVLTVLQYFTGQEFLVLSLTSLAIALVLAWVLHPEMTRPKVRDAIVAASVAALVAVPLLAFPVWFFFDGPRRVVGPFWTMYGAPPSAILAPVRGLWNSTPKLKAVGYLGARGPGVDYLGAGLVGAAIVTAFVRRRDRLVRGLFALAVISWALSVSPPGLWSWAPVLDGIEVHRYVAIADLTIGLTAAVGLEALWRHLRSRDLTVSRATSITGVALAVTLAPTMATYSVPFRVVPTSTPPWYSDAGRHVPSGTAVLALPFDYELGSAPMAWQAEMDYPFALVGGWALVPGADGRHDQIISPPNGVVRDLRILSRAVGCLSAPEQLALRATLERWAPLEIVLARPRATPGVAAATTATLGVAPQHVDGALVWHLFKNRPLGHLRPLRPTSCSPPDWLTAS